VPIKTGHLCLINTILYNNERKNRINNTKTYQSIAILMTVLLHVTCIFLFIQISTICHFTSDTFNLLTYATCQCLLDVIVEVDIQELEQQLGGSTASSTHYYRVSRYFSWHQSIGTLLSSIAILLVASKHWHCPPQPAT